MNYLTRLFEVYDFIKILDQQFRYKELVKLQRINRTIFWILHNHLPKNLTWKLSEHFDSYTETCDYQIQIFTEIRSTLTMIHQQLYDKIYDNQLRRTIPLCMVEKIFQQNTMYHIETEHFKNIVQIFDKEISMNKLDLPTLKCNYKKYYLMWDQTIEIVFCTTRK
jgi:hypothetical protein